MKIARTSNFMGLAEQFPVTLRPAVNDLQRRINLELDNLFRILQDANTTSRDASATLAIPSGERVYIQKADGTTELVEVPFSET